MWIKAERYIGFSFPSGCLLQVLYPPKEPPEKTAQVGGVQLLSIFLLSAAPPPRNKSALISCVLWGQGQVCQCDARVPVLPRLPEHCVFTRGQSFQGTILKTVQLVKILCQIPQDTLNNTQYWIKSSIKSTWLHFMGPAIDCAYLQKVLKFTTFTWFRWQEMIHILLPAYIFA